MENTDNSRNVATVFDELKRAIDRGDIMAVLAFIADDENKKDFPNLPLCSLLVRYEEDAPLLALAIQHGYQETETSRAIAAMNRGNRRTPRPLPSDRCPYDTGSGCLCDVPGEEAGVLRAAWDAVIIAHCGN